MTDLPLVIDKLNPNHPSLRSVLHHNICGSAAALINICGSAAAFHWFLRLCRSITAWDSAAAYSLSAALPQHNPFLPFRADAEISIQWGIVSSLLSLTRCRYTDPFPPLRSGSNSGAVIPVTVTVREGLNCRSHLPQFRGKKGWPSDDLKAIEAVKLAFFMQLIPRLKAAQKQSNLKVSVMGD